MSNIPLRMTEPSGGGPRLDSPSPSSSYSISINLEPSLQSSKGPALYSVDITFTSSNPPLSWRVIRRYSEFLSLRNELTDLDVIPLSLDRSFPPRHTLAPSNDAAVVSERVRLLPVWLSGVSRNAQCTQTQVFRSFLNLDAFDRELDRASGSLLTSATISSPSKLQQQSQSQLSQSSQPQPIILSRHQQHQHATVETASCNATIDLHVPSLTVDPHLIVMPVGRALAASKAIAAAAKAARATADVLAQTAKTANDAADESAKMLTEVKASCVRIDGSSVTQSNHRVNLIDVELDNKLKQHIATTSAKAALDQDNVASNLEAEALSKLRIAHDMHVKASAELLFAQHAISEGAYHEERLHVIEACAASARAKIAVKQAASDKAEEEAALTALDDAYVAVQTADRAVKIAQTTFESEKKRVEDLKISALFHKVASARETQAAALASAQQDAHSKAAEFSFEQARAAIATEREITTIMTETGNLNAVSEAKKLIDAKPRVINNSSAVPHEGVSMTSRHVQGVGRALTTPGPNAALQVTALGIKRE